MRLKFPTVVAPLIRAATCPLLSIIIVVGIPGSGKSTWVQKQLSSLTNSYVIINADSVRKELYGDESIQGNPKMVFQILHDRFRRALLNNKIKTIFILIE